MKHVQSAEQNLHVAEAPEPELAHAEISCVYFALAMQRGPLMVIGQWHETNEGPNYLCCRMKMLSPSLVGDPRGIATALGPEIVLVVLCCIVKFVRAVTIPLCLDLLGACLVKSTSIPRMLKALFSRS